MHIRVFALLLLALALSACASDTLPTPTVATVGLEPPTPSINVGATQTFSATARDAAGNPMTGFAFTWASSNPQVATVSGGVATGLRAGTTNITASAGGKTSAPVLLTVSAPASFRLSVTPEKLPVWQGADAALSVTVERDEGFSGAIALSLTGLPEGSSTPSLTIPADATEAVVTIRASATAPHSLPTTVTLTGTSGGATATKTLSVTVRGQAGELDTSFAGGLVRTDIQNRSDEANAVAVQSDGKVIAVGSAITTGFSDLAVVRYERDGSLDTSFGSGGTVVLKLSEQNDRADAVAVQADGKIVVAGTVLTTPVDRDMVVVRLNADGTPDTNFGTGGQVVVSFGTGNDQAFALALQPDGKIIVAGESYQGTVTGTDFALARLNADGSFDTSFGTGGKVAQPIADVSGRDSIYALLLQSVSGELRIVAVGGEGDFALARFTASGQLDANFGTNGKVRRLFNASVGAAKSVALDNQGNLVVAGHISHQFALVRFSAAGSLDTSFGTDGKVITAVSTVNWNEATSVVVQSDDKVVVGGWAATSSSSQGDFALVRYHANGSLDTSFGAAGITLTPLPEGFNFNGGRALALQADDRVPTIRALLGGFDNDFALARYWL